MKNRAICNYKLSKLADAMADYNMLIALDPNNEEFYGVRGICYLKTGQFNRAKNDFSEVIELDPKNAEAYFNRANVYLKSDEKTKACNDLALSYKNGYAKAKVYSDQICK
jgi:Flp pilus assembly protein TadD